jgi:hypothetical protein
MKEPSRPEPRCTEPVAEPLAQYIWEKLKHDLGFPPPRAVRRPGTSSDPCRGCSVVK